MTAGDTMLTICWFPTGMPDGPAIGDPERTNWSNFVDVFWWRREGDKDGPNFIPARFALEPDGRHVRRLKCNLLARTAVALDCETNKKTGEIPPTVNEVAARIRNTVGPLLSTRHTIIARKRRATASCCRCRRRPITAYLRQR